MRLARPPAKGGDASKQQRAVQAPARPRNYLAMAIDEDNRLAKSAARDSGRCLLSGIL